MKLDIDIRRKAFADRGGRPHLALSGLRLSVAPGEFVCLVGPSGCGKSTLLNLIGGLDRDFEGQLDWGGPAPEALGFMFQSPRLMPWLTVLDNVLLVTPDPAASRARAIALLEAMELGPVLHAHPGSLSGGMQRRVALARAFVNEPRLLLMDEPFVSLDAPTAARLREQLQQQWARSDAAVVFVTHDLCEALTLADRVCFLSAAPAALVHDLRVALPRPRSPEDPAVRQLAQAMVARYPELLSGQALAQDQGPPSDSPFSRRL